MVVSKLTVHASTQYGEKENLTVFLHAKGHMWH